METIDPESQRVLDKITYEDARAYLDALLCECGCGQNHPRSEWFPFPGWRKSCHFGQISHLLLSILWYNRIELGDSLGKLVCENTLIQMPRRLENSTRTVRP